MATFNPVRDPLNKSREYKLIYIPYKDLVTHDLSGCLVCQQITGIRLMQQGHSSVWKFTQYILVLYGNYSMTHALFEAISDTKRTS